jgi:hypothetical protein
MTDSTDHSGHFASTVTKAIDQIGDRAADELNRIADQIEADAKDKAAAIRRFGESFRQTSRTASADVGLHCAKATDIFSSIGMLEARIVKEVPLDDLKRLAATSPHNGGGNAEDA